MDNKQAVRKYFRERMRERRKNIKPGKRSYVSEIENLQVIMAHWAGAITWDELCRFFDLDPAEYTTLAKTDDIRQAAIEAGKGLAR